MADVRGLHHVAVQLKDLEAAERFYSGVLGLPVLRRWPDGEGGLRSVWVETGGGSFLALERADEASSVPAERPFRDGAAGWHLVALRIERSKREAWERRLEAAGVEIVHRTRWTLYVRDPEGNRVGLSHHPEE